MKFKRTLLFLLAVTTCLETIPNRAFGKPQSTKRYQQMSESERTAFVSEQARRVARDMSGTDYHFTPDFEAAIQKNVDSYAQRIGNNSVEPGKSDLQFVFERGESLAATLNTIFKKRSVSPLIGLYIPLIESEYLNLPSPNPSGSIGMFQFLPQTGEQFGLSASDLLDIGKSADAAARYILRSMQRFENEPMKEALAILSYNRGAGSVAQDLSLATAENSACGICVLTENSNKLDPTFETESVHYVPRFFAAAIIGENPQAFGLHTQPLSSL